MFLITRYCSYNIHSKRLWKLDFCHPCFTGCATYKDYLILTGNLQSACSRQRGIDVDKAAVVFAFHRIRQLFMMLEIAIETQSLMLPIISNGCRGSVVLLCNEYICRNTLLDRHRPLSIDSGYNMRPIYMRQPCHFTCYIPYLVRIYE